ncbi:MAG: hypothetical protein E4H32_07135 [Nitrospirales bacterium]|nr:MAG: hypothetical protein E4H32_07135 [Nitrospirales bacterium]
MDFSQDELKMVRFFVEREGDGILASIREIDFITEGIIDSLDMISLAVFIEKNFGKKLDLTDKNILKAVSRFDSLMSLIGQ